MLMKVFSDLKARCATPHNQYGPRRQFTGIAVCARMQLADIIRHIGTERWNDTLFALSSGMTTLLASMAPAFVRSK
jgi:hypothetical protein